MSRTELLRRRSIAAALVIALVTLTGPATAALGHDSFRPRIGDAMGLVPRAGHDEIATGTNLLAVYHGGSVMHGVTIHTIFWAPPGFRFTGPPSSGTEGYESVVQRFFTDVAHDSGQASNVFSVLAQYGDLSGPGRYDVRYDTAANSFDDVHPYPAAARQCASPSGVATCITDLQLQRELDRVIQSRDPGARGLTNLWLVFLPPDVDTCISPGACGTNDFGGYHSLSNMGHGPTIYANVPDPLVETTAGPGSDPQGNPDAEAALDVAAEETVEAITDPEGVGWMDPNGNEIVDKCDAGPEQGTPLGFAPNGSPFNQIVNGDEYLIQMMWSNARSGCVQRSAIRRTALPLPTVNLTQFSSSISGNAGLARPGVSVTVGLRRAGALVARATAITRASGGWGPVSLRAVSRGPAHGFGDDRDEIDIRYGPHGPRNEVILTGDGGNPFTEAGWTGWFDLDHGYAVGSRSVLLAPCSQTGVLALYVGRSPTAPPVELCQTETDAASVPTRQLTAGTPLAVSSQDNRAVSAQNRNGALVKLTVPLGEPDSVPAFENPQSPFATTGFPSCTADLQAQAVRCTGLVPGSRYAVTRRRDRVARHGWADANGVIVLGGFPGTDAIRGGDVLTLTNRVHRVLVALHVAHLRVAIRGEQTVIASGSCEPGDYYGPPLSTPPVGPEVGQGVTGLGRICPVDGSARGLTTLDIAQSDDRGSGQTRTEVPDLEGTSPTPDETLYGPFVAFAQAGLPGADHSVVASRARVRLTITRPSGGAAVFRAANVDTASGVPVRALAPGVYLARWVLSDANGDTRSVTTRFVQEP